MKAHTALTYRLGRLGIWFLILLLILALAAGSIVVALRQARAVHQVRLQGLRDRAENTARRLQSNLLDMADERIAAARQAFINRDDPAMNRLIEESRWIEMVFAYDHRTLITWPPVPVPRAERPHEAFAPPGFGLAEQLEFVDHNLEEAITLYQRCTGEGTPVYWQLRAHMAIAGCRAKQRRFDESIEIYRRLQTRFSLVLRGLDEPSLFSVNLALIDVLTQAGRRQEAGATAEALLRDAENGQIPIPVRAYTDLLIRRLSDLTGAPREEVRRAESRLAAVAARQQELTGAVVSVRTWMEPRLDLPHGRKDSGVQFLNDMLCVPPRVLVYRRSESPGSDPVVGLSIPLPQLFQSLILPTINAAAQLDLTVHQVGRGVPDGIPWSIILPAPLQYWRIQPSAVFLDGLEREVRRQTWVYVTLTLIGLAVLAGAVGIWLVALRREVALSRLKNEFVANVSHELKTPLALIRLFGETLMSGRAVGDQKRQEYYRVITRESERLTHLIDNILDFSRIEAGHKRYERTPCDLGEVVRQTVESYRLQLDHHGFTCEVDIRPGLPSTRADANAISQAVLNLLNNAVKYSQENKYVGVRVERHRRSGQEGVLITVADRGIGIPPEEQERLFESFFRGSHEVVRATRGTGLGLTLVRHIVAGHDGDLWVDSTPGSGSTFAIFLPEA